MRLVERGFEHHKNILDEKNLDFLSKKFDLIFAENKNKIQNKEFKVKSIPDNQSFHFASNKERKLVGNLEFYEKNNERFLICIHNVEVDYPEVKDFFFNTIYDNAFSELQVKGRLVFDRINLIKKTEGDNHSMDWHRHARNIGLDHRMEYARPNIARQFANAQNPYGGHKGKRLYCNHHGN